MEAFYEEQRTALFNMASQHFDKKEEILDIISSLYPDKDKEHSRLIREKFFITTGERELNRRLELERMKTHGTAYSLQKLEPPFGLGHAIDPPLLLSFSWLGWLGPQNGRKGIAFICNWLVRPLVNIRGRRSSYSYPLSGSTLIIRNSYINILPLAC